MIVIQEVVYPDDSDPGGYILVIVIQEVVYPDERVDPRR